MHGTETDSGQGSRLSVKPVCELRQCARRETEILKEGRKVLIRLCLFVYVLLTCFACRGSSNSSISCASGE